MTRFIVVRHGETQWNIAARIQGHGDSALTEIGMAQADAIAQRLVQEPFDVLVSSDLGRAMQTAGRIGAATGREIIPDARFRERCFGSAEGLAYAELHERFPGAHLQENDPDFRFPESESRREFYVRIADAFEALANEHAGKQVAVVCHGGVLAALYRHIHGIAASQPASVEIPNAAYNRVLRESSKWTIEAWADTTHFDAGWAAAGARGSILARMS
jgi:2,3-bisphosphoglycerate-dependent phosphoglycerate mutase